MQRCIQRGLEVRAFGSWRAYAHWLAFFDTVYNLVFHLSPCQSSHLEDIVHCPMPWDLSLKSHWYLNIIVRLNPRSPGKVFCPYLLRDCIPMTKTHRNCKLKMKLQRIVLGHLREEVLATNPAQLPIGYYNITHLLLYGWRSNEAQAWLKCYLSQRFWWLVTTTHIKGCSTPRSTSVRVKARREAQSELNQ